LFSPELQLADSFSEFKRLFIMTNKRALFLFLLTGMLSGLIISCDSKPETRIQTPLFTLSWPSSSVDSWKYTLKKKGEPVEIKLPVFEIDGIRTPVLLTSLVETGKPVTLRNGVTEYIYEGAFRKDTTLRLQVRFRVAADNPVVRFCYMFKSSAGAKLTKMDGADHLSYLSLSFSRFPQVKEISLSVFNEMIHSCHLTETRIYEADFSASASAVGPILIGTGGKKTLMCAYEHDSMYPNHFLEYRFDPGENVELKAVRGNYYDGQAADGYQTVWFELAEIDGDEDTMAEQFRLFILKYQPENSEIRKPYIYYNTWGRQERVKWAGGQYLTTMNLEYTLKEIDRAHEMGIEFYVLDAGWFDRAGDWGVNVKNFPDGFTQICDKIESCGMKLGIWMDPAKAAVNSQAFQKNQNCMKTWNNKPNEPSLVWETEESVNMCLVSPYWEAYADAIIRLYNSLGIRYFYLDGVGQSGCNDPGHFHGTAENKLTERDQSYGFLLPVYLGKIMEKVFTACPDVIFDFDVTESRRIGVGLQFLANGRFFILNNGPYYHNFDLCPQGESILPNGCRNIFIQPGPARTWFMRSVLEYDKWIPSNLFLANYQPDDPVTSQIINLASLVLGQNSIWGEILKTSPEGVALFHDILEKYKQVRYDVSAASPIFKGRPGDTPEIVEKINPETGKGVVVIFANSGGTFTYITKNKVADGYIASGNSQIELANSINAKIEVAFEHASAEIVFFGAE
jgi:alpha-galactosidase